MKRKLQYLIILCLFAASADGFIPAAAAAQDGTNPKPQALITIRNIDQFLNDIDTLIPPAQGSPAMQPTAMLRMLLQGTGWIDPQRCIVAGMVSNDAKSKWIILIPFRTANPSFQMTSGAIAGENYYLAAFPPEPGFSVNPAIKESLLEASTKTATGSLVVEAAVGPFLDAAEAQLTASMKILENLPKVQTGPSAMSPQESLGMVTEMLKSLRQAETLRYGLDISGDTLTLQLDVDALPNTPMASALTDPGGDSRLMNYPIDMPLQYRSRAFNKTEMINVIGSSFGSIYRKIGIDFDKMAEMVKYFTGEAAGGMKISSDGLASEAINILQPGINGEAFISNTYLPWLENISLQMSSLAAQQTGKPPTPLYQRTADSTVAGIKVVGVKTIPNATIPIQKPLAAIFQATEIRIAAIGDLMFAASDDAKLESLINGTRNLNKSVVQGPIFRFSVNLADFFKNIQTLVPTSGAAIAWPENLGPVNVVVNMNNGKLATRTSININDLRKLAETMKTLLSKPTGFVGEFFLAQ